MALTGIEVALLDGIDAAASRSLRQQRLQALQFGFFTHGHYFDVATFSIPDPTPQAERGGLTMDKPAKAHALYAAFDEVIANHSD